MNVLILGDGAWGTAISKLFLENGHSTTFWKKGMKVRDGSIIFCALPVNVMREVLTDIEDIRCVFINGSKGIEKDTHLLPYQIVKEVLSEVDYLTLMGPSFAEELNQKMPTLVNLGFRNEETATKVKGMLQTGFFRIKLTKSVRALELSAAFKNIYAIACGLADGFGYKVNTRVKLMLLAIVELESLREKLEFKSDSNTLPATIGDLVLTCSSSESRNYTFGRFLSSRPLKKSLEKVEATVEGYYAAKSVPYFVEQAGVSLPLAKFVYETCYGNGWKDIRKNFLEFVKNS